MLGSGAVVLAPSMPFVPEMSLCEDSGTLAESRLSLLMRLLQFLGLDWFPIPEAHLRVSAEPKRPVHTSE